MLIHRIHVSTYLCMYVCICIYIYGVYKIFIIYIYNMIDMYMTFFVLIVHCFHIVVLDKPHIFVKK